ncbi:MAG: FtsX-like permease family protein [Pseudomonadota bacterium]
MRPTASITTALAVFAAQLRDRPLRLVVSVAAIAVGIALAAAVHLINASALAEFGRATRELSGTADLAVRGTKAGFEESLYARLASRPGVRVASPVLLREAALVAGGTLPIEGVDPLLAAALRPELYGELAGLYVALLAPDALVLSASAARDLKLVRGDWLSLRVGELERRLRIVAVLPAEATARRLGLMDISSAQWLTGSVGLLSRIDLRLAPGLDAARYAAELQLPAGVDAMTPALEQARAGNLTRAYRVNLDMLALVALLTGAFLVYATQALAVMRRRRQLALLRALGVRRGELRLAVLVEGAAVGAVGGVLGTALGWLIARLVLSLQGGDLGAGLLQTATTRVATPPLALALFIALGMVVAVAGAWLPARRAAEVAPARALKAGDEEAPAAVRDRLVLASVLLTLGAGCAFVPPLYGLPLGGYASIACLLAGAVLLVPAFVAATLAHLPTPRSPLLALLLARLRNSIAQSAVSLAAIVVSFSLMVAMAIMVHSFRDSFERWLGAVLPADIYLRVSPAADTFDLSAAAAATLAAVPGVARIELRRTTQLSLAPAQPPVTLIARALPRSGGSLPLVGYPLATDPALPVAFVSEALRDLYGVQPGGVLELPIAGRAVRFAVAGLWRDYARSTGSVVVDLASWERLTGERRYTEASVWLAPRAAAESVRTAIEARLQGGDALQVIAAGALKQRALAAFDRAFAITYALEAVAVGIGLLGVVLAFAVQALARRAEFGMLRHLGLRRGQVLRMLAGEGAFLAAVGVGYGLLVGLLLSVVLVYVVNRQSFHWTLDYIVPVGQLALVALVLVATAALTAGISGRVATSGAVVRAVREDW